MSCASRASLRVGTARREVRSEEHTSELQSQSNLVCRLLLEKKKIKILAAPLAGDALFELLTISGRASGVLKHDFVTLCCIFFFFNDTATTEIYTLSLHDALPISPGAK